jgi:hypothetical protein
MAKYIVSLLTALYLVSSPANVLAVDPSDLVKLKKAGLPDEVIIAVAESNAINRAIISLDEIIAMKSMPDIVLVVIEDANQPIPDRDRKDARGLTARRHLKRARMKLKIQKKELKVVRGHLSKLMMNPEILKLVKAGKISFKDYADIAKYLKQHGKLIKQVESPNVPPPLSVTAKDKKTEKPKVIMGSTKADVDVLLKDWSSRKSNLSTASRPIYYYTKDVSVIVHFRDDKAGGIAVIDRPGAGVTSISQTRYDELVKLIGQKPKTGDIKRDSSGIHEFYVGDTD